MATLTREIVTGAIKMVRAMKIEDAAAKETAMRDFLTQELGSQKDPAGASLVDKVMDDLKSYPEWAS